MQGRNSNSARSSRFFVDAKKSGGYPTRRIVDEFEMEKLGKQLLINAAIPVLDFSFSNLGDEGVIFLAKSLRHNSTVVTLKLADSQMTDLGLAALVVMLKTNKTLLEVDVSRNLFKAPVLLDKLALTLGLNKQIFEEAEKRKATIVITPNTSGTMVANKLMRI